MGFCGCNGFGTYRYGAKVTLPATLPERTGYAFAGWKNEDGKEPETIFDALQNFVNSLLWYIILLFIVYEYFSNALSHFIYIG